ncbi:MAG: hypothetical protein ACR2NT_05475 [Acidimicrobiia bacterium]
MRAVGIDGDYESDEPGLVFGATGIADDWPSIRSVLLEAFRLTQLAVVAVEPIVYVVSSDDLLGRNGAASAAVAAGLVSAGRTAGIELANAGLPINVIAIDDEIPGDQVKRWVQRMLEADGAQGELIHLGPGHLGKALG